MEDGFDEDIEFGDEISDDDEDDVDNVSSYVIFKFCIYLFLYYYLITFLFFLISSFYS